MDRCVMAPRQTRTALGGVCTYSRGESVGNQTCCLCVHVGMKTRT